ncbi:hypothetical protein ACOME3_002870 [Neoechinorhynchus agilis]
MICLPQYPGISYETRERDEEMKNDFEYRWNSRKSDPCISIHDFRLKRTLIEGEFSRLVLATRIDQPKEKVALKIISKSRLSASNQSHYSLREKRILGACRHPFIVNFIFCFKDNSYLYLGLEYSTHGTLRDHLTIKRRFVENDIQIIYRNLRPETIAVTNRGYVKLCDFELSKKIDGWTATFCGMPQYMAPEMYLLRPYTDAVDWWTLGVLIFEMITGGLPFVAANLDGLCEAITQKTIEYPPLIAASVRDIVENLLCKVEIERMGYFDGAREIKDHYWFSNLNFSHLFSGKVEFLLDLPPMAAKTRFSEEVPIYISANNHEPNLFDEF